MNNFVVGIDGGGSKTDVILVDVNGRIVDNIQGDCTNYQIVGAQNVKHKILKLINELLKRNKVSYNKIEWVFLGLAGVGRKSDQNAVTKIFQDTDFRNRISVENDAIIALAGAFGNKPGIILISGTGSICLGKNKNGEIARSGGWGYLLGDEGSGYFIGHEAIIAALKDFDGRAEKTLLKDVLMQKCNLKSIDEIIPLVYQNKLDRVAIANFAPLVFEQAIKGDDVAQGIIKKTGKELGLLAKAVALKLGFLDNNFKVALVGSIFKQKEMLENEIAKEIYDVSWDAKIIEPDFNPAVGAVLLALEKSGVIISDSILSNLCDSNNFSIHQNLSYYDN